MGWKAMVVMLTVLLGAVGAVLAWQRQIAGGLCDEIAVQRQENRELTRAKAENARLKAAQVSAAELEALRADRAAVGRLRGEIAALRTRVEAMEARATTPAALAAAQVLVPADAWQNIGRATPAAAFETLLWKAARGDVESVAGSILFAPSAKATAQAWFTGLPEAERARHGSIERVVAQFLVRDAARIGAMRVIVRREMAPDTTELEVRRQNTDGRSQADRFVFQNTSGGWRMVVPERVAGRLASMAAGTQAMAGGK